MSFFAFSLRYLYKPDTPGTDIPHIIAVAGSIIGFGILWFFDRKKSAAFGSNVPWSKRNYRRLFTVPAAFSINILSLFYYLAKSEFSTEMTLVNNLLNMNNSRVFVSLVSGSLYAIIAVLFYAGLSILNPKKVIKQFNLRVFALFCSIVLILTISYVRVFITHYTIFPKAAVLGGTGHTAGPWLTWHDDPESAICVSWFTAEKKSTRMYYGKDPDNLNLTVSRKDDVFLHKVFIENLSPGTTYHYRIDETFETLHSFVLFSFRTAPVVQRPFEFVVLGDMQPGDDIT
ncbi:MAG: fibronectin type III domain-containing protein, partial [Spirochaetes bacterium]|nr:fibronectin type III domain-containing protein [Spirochaetota bacterium]